MKKINKILVVPDSFKGGMTSQKICDIVEKAAFEHCRDTQVIKIPVADGGEGTVDAMLATNGGKRIEVLVKGPFFDDIKSFYGILPDNTAVIEMAAAAGLPLANGRLNPLIATTYGVGQLMLHAQQSGCSSIILAMGGSATNDAGCGMASAIGVRFYDKDNNIFVPSGGTLSNINKIDMTGCMLTANVTAMCDIDNPLYGLQGAAYIFSPQKGADEQTVKILDDGLQSFAAIIKEQLGVDVSEIAGAGAAGGLGAGAVCFLNAKLKMGIEVVLDTVNFDKLLANADLVITGEGKIDTQSLRGKVVIGVAKRAKMQSVPVAAIVGDIGENIDTAYEMGVSAIFSINRVAIPFEKAVQRSEKDLYLTVSDILRFTNAILK